MELEGVKLENDDLIVRLVDDNRIVCATAQLVYIKTESRTAFLLEEVFVPIDLRGNGYAKLLCEMVIKWVQDNTPVDRIEGTVNESAPKVFEMYLSAGFKDRKNRTFVWARDWKEP